MCQGLFLLPGLPLPGIPPVVQGSLRVQQLQFLGLQQPCLYLVLLQLEVLLLFLQFGHLLLQLGILTIHRLGLLPALFLLLTHSPAALSYLLDVLFQTSNQTALPRKRVS